jgi:hypothetical protein
LRKHRAFFASVAQPHFDVSLVGSLTNNDLQLVGVQAAITSPKGPRWRYEINELAHLPISALATYWLSLMLSSEGPLPFFSNPIG